MPGKFSINLDPTVQDWLSTRTNYPDLWQNIFGISTYVVAISTTSLHLVSKNILTWDTTVGRSPLRNPSLRQIEKLYIALTQCHRITIHIRRTYGGDFEVKMKYLTSGEEAKSILEIIGTVDPSNGIKDLYFV